ncbi:MAG TPA: TIGR02281 family clan AA aspartic protease [Rhodocyclaceae bacterium]
MRAFVVGFAILAFVSSAIAGKPAVFPSVPADECGREAYAAPEDYSDSYPLTRPHAELAKTLAAARKGNALEQRNLAASYESGYLVSQCLSKAAHWYRQAAKGGDEVAKNWVARRDVFDKLSAGPECMEVSCNVPSYGEHQALSLVSDPMGHFFTTLTINGVTVRGMIDTGASTIAMSYATAASMGVSLDGQAGQAITANGVVAATMTVVPRVRVGSIDLDNVEVGMSANNSMVLIGMSVLRRLRISASDGQMLLSK